MSDHLIIPEVIVDDQNRVDPVQWPNFGTESLEELETLAAPNGLGLCNLQVDRSI